MSWIVTCEHGGREVPGEFAALFDGHEALLDSHRGWDPGALPMAEALAGALGGTLVAATATRLLVDLNRSLHHRRLFSEVTRALPAPVRADILDRHYRPWREAVEGRVSAAIAAGLRVVHVSSHSFAGDLDGARRTADVGLLYDPARAGERMLCAAWSEALKRTAPGLRVRRNYPYRGVADGLTTSLRRRHGEPDYLGIELELCQDVTAGATDGWRPLHEAVARSLAEAAASLGPC